MNRIKGQSVKEISSVLTIKCDSTIAIYLLLFFFASLIKTVPIKAPITDIANTSTAAGIAIAYIRGGNSLRMAESSTKGCKGEQHGNYYNVSPSED